MTVLANFGEEVYLNPTLNIHVGLSKFGLISYNK